MKKILTLLMFAFLTVTAGATGKQLYLCGNEPAGNGWGYDAAHQVAMTYDSGTGINTASITVTNQIWFCVSDGSGTGDTDDAAWADYHNNHRWGYTADITAGGSYTLVKASNDNQYSVSLKAGFYDISINSETMVMTISFQPAYSVVGDAALGLAWEPANTALIMTKKSETVYELIKENVTLIKGKSYYWRVLVNAGNDGWDADKYGASGKNATGDDNVITTVDATAKYNATFTLDLSSGDASIPTVTATLADGQTQHCIYVDDQTEWGATKLYAYGTDLPDLFGEWGTTLSFAPETVTYGTKTYKKFPFVANDGTYNLIFSDNGSESGRVTLDNVVAEKDYFITLTTSAATILTSVSVETSNEYSTYVTPAPMNFSGLGVKAYKASSANASAVTLTEVTAVPVGTPLILKGTGMFSVPTVASAEAIEGNLLKAGGVSIGGSDNYDYILKSDALFHRVTTESALAADKAYLHLDSQQTSARSLNIEFEDGETTGIETVNSEEVKVKSYYNLAGQRIAHPTKGLYITNGKKVLLP